MVQQIVLHVPLKMHRLVVWSIFVLRTHVHKIVAGIFYKQALVFLRTLHPVLQNFSNETKVLTKDEISELFMHLPVPGTHQEEMVQLCFKHICQYFLGKAVNRLTM